MLLGATTNKLLSQIFIIKYLNSYIFKAYTVQLRQIVTNGEKWTKDTFRKEKRCADGYKYAILSYLRILSKGFKAMNSIASRN